MSERKREREGMAGKESNKGKESIEGKERNEGLKRATKEMRVMN